MTPTLISLTDIHFYGYLLWPSSAGFFRYRVLSLTWSKTFLEWTLVLPDLFYKGLSYLLSLGSVSDIMTSFFTFRDLFKKLSSDINLSPFLVEFKTELLLLS